MCRESIFLHFFCCVGIFDYEKALVCGQNVDNFFKTVGLVVCIVENVGMIVENFFGRGFRRRKSKLALFTKK